VQSFATRRRHNLTPALDGSSFVAFNQAPARLSLHDTTKTGAREQTSAPRASLSENPSGVRFGKFFLPPPGHHSIQPVPNLFLELADGFEPPASDYKSVTAAPDPELSILYL